MTEREKHDSLTCREDQRRKLVMEMFKVAWDHAVRSGQGFMPKIAAEEVVKASVSYARRSAPRKREPTRTTGCAGSMKP